MATSDFKIFANGQSLVGEETLNIAPLDDEQLVTETKTGFYSGLASSKKFNRVLRQGTAGTATIADLIVEVLAEDVKDDGTPLKEQLRRAITKTVETDGDFFIKTVNGVSPIEGDVTVNDYVTDLTVSGRTITFNKKDGTSGTIITQDTSDGEIARVVETYYSETQWYRKWSDGFVEQGGFVPSALISTSDFTTCSLPTPMSTTTYTVVLTSYSYGTDLRAPTAKDKYTTAFTFQNINGSEKRCNESVYWMVSGH